MAPPSATQRLQRPLAVVAVVLALAGIVAVFVRAGDDDPDRSLDRSGGDSDVDQDGSTDDGAGEDVATPTVPGDDGPGASSSTTSGPSPLAASMAVPAAGTYRYEVERVRDGESETFEESRTFEVLAEEGDTTRVRLDVTTDGQRQVSTLEWTAAAVTVRSTRLPTASGEGSECSWAPPITEFGALTDGASWTVSSTCTAEVAGVPSTFAVEGSGTVLGDVVIRVGERDVRVWRIERLRTTVITADIGGRPVEQRVEERGDLYVDPTRGIVVRAEAVLVRSGPQEGTTRRVSSLVE